MCRCAYPQDILNCLELPFIVYSILKQCWSVGYVSLLTLSSFLRYSGYIRSSVPLACRKRRLNGTVFRMKPQIPRPRSQQIIRSIRSYQMSLKPNKILQFFTRNGDKSIRTLERNTINQSIS